MKSAVKFNESRTGLDLSPVREPRRAWIPEGPVGKGSLPQHQPRAAWTPPASPG